MKLRAIFIAVFVSALGPLQGAICENEASFDLFVECVFKTHYDAKLAKNAPGKQTEMPSLATNSTTLVDQSSAADLIGVAFNLTGSATNSGLGQGNIVTATAYSVYAALTRQDPLNPEVYTRNSHLRRLSFILGSDVPDNLDKADSPRGDVYGFKFLLSQGREASRLSTDDRASLNKALVEAVTNDSASWKQNVHHRLFLIIRKVKPASTADLVGFLNSLTLENWQAHVYSKLTELERDDIVKTITEHASPYVALKEDIVKIVNKVRNAPQWSFQALTKKRKDTGGNDYRLQMIYDRGLVGPTMLVANAGFDYKDLKAIGGDTRGGRAALEFRTRLAGDNPYDKSAPLTFALSGEGKWMTGSKPIYRAQARLIIPLGTPGIELPISFTYSTRKDLIQESDVRGQIGFTIDPAKIFEALRR